MTKRILFPLMLMLTTFAGAWAQVNYITCSWNDITKTVDSEVNTCTSYTSLSSSLYQLDSGWYVLDEDVTYANRLVVKGDVKLILLKGCTLTAPRGIFINTSATLTIYEQSLSGTNKGKIVAYTDVNDWAAIGGNKNEQAGRLIIHGGHISAKANKKYAAAIGGGYGDGSGMKEITIWGGTVEGTATTYGAGIGAGKNNKKIGSITIYGGDITANGGEKGAGIGGSENRSGWDTTIYGGTVNAQGGKNGAGIGGGEDGKGGNITILGGNITATGGESGAGIGGGEDGDGGNITIRGGNITATGGERGAGIGGGAKGIGESIEIFDGVVNAYGNLGGAGIGGGAANLWFLLVTDGGDAGTIKIHGGEVHAETTKGGGAAIGGGHAGDGGTIVIDGGKVLARATYDGSYGSIVIGYGFSTDTKGDAGTIYIGGTAYVDVKNNSRKVAKQFGTNYKGLTLDGSMTVTDASDTPHVRCSTSSRKDTCLAILRQIIIQPCDHSELTYDYVDETTHTAHCKYCEYKTTEEHHILSTSTTCAECGYGEAATFCTLTFPQAQSSSVEGYVTTSYQAVKGQPVTLIECAIVPEGWEFAGWQQLGLTDVPSTIEAGDDEELLQTGDLYEVTGDAAFFARYRQLFEEEWTWSSDLSTAKLTLTTVDGTTMEVTDVTVSRTEAAATASDDGYIAAEAEATYTSGSTTYTFTQNRSMTLYYGLDLDETDNTAALADNDGRNRTVTLTDRTLYKDGSWNTLCLPFDMVIEGSVLEGATVKELTDAAYDAATGTLTLTFDDAATIEAGQAYLIKWESGSDDIYRPTFTGVTISNSLSDDELSVDDEGTATVTFLGTYQALTFDADDKSILFLGANNTLYYPKSGATIGAQRAYFKLSGITAGDLPQQARSFVLDFGDGEATGIIEITDPTPGPSPAWEGSGCAWYSLDGRRLSAKPTQRGVYINNGRKIVIK